MGRNKDYSYVLMVSGISEKQANKLDMACRKAKSHYAHGGRGTSFTGKSSDVGKHFAPNDRRQIEGR